MSRQLRPTLSATVTSRYGAPPVGELENPCSAGTPDTHHHLDGNGIHTATASVAEVASILGVSTATVRNWIKAGHLTPLSTRPFTFSKEAALTLKMELFAGSVTRLRGRANKTRSQATFIPTEYVSCPRVIETVDSIVQTVRRENLDAAATMLVVALRWLELHGEVKRQPDGNLLDHETFHSWKRTALKNEIIQWRKIVDSPAISRAHSLYFAVSEASPNDLLGLLYQSLTCEGVKSDFGSYYTPPDIVRDSLTSTPFTGKSFFDPCCGTGQYLVAASRLLSLSPAGIYGCDVDPLATRIARVNLLLAAPSYDSRPNIECLDALSELATGDLYCESNHFLGSIDFIATNPPWGAFKTSRYSACAETLGLSSSEAFALFLAKAVLLLKDGGRLSFVLPESILNIRAHSDIRELLLYKTTLTRITQLGRPFAGVFTPAIRLDAIKEEPGEESSIAIVEKEKQYVVLQNRFKANHLRVFNIGVTESDSHLINKLYEVDHVTLAANADWALGIVTGNNTRFVSTQKLPGMEPVFRGNDINAFRFGDPRSFILFEPSQFQQVARTELYRAPEKLVYRFITDRLTFAYDADQRLTLNSANIVIPRLPGISIKATLAFLNSNVFQFLFRRKYATHKVLRGDLEQLPFPTSVKSMMCAIENLVNELIIGDKRRYELEDIIYGLFEMTGPEIAHVEKAVCNS
jgi:SAM-dependent methyltransferase